MRGELLLHIEEMADEVLVAQVVGRAIRRRQNKKRLSYIAQALGPSPPPGDGA